MELTAPGPHAGLTSALLRREMRRAADLLCLAAGMVAKAPRPTSWPTNYITDALSAHSITGSLTQALIHSHAGTLPDRHLSHYADPSKFRCACDWHEQHAEWTHPHMSPPLALRPSQPHPTPPSHTTTWTHPNTHVSPPPRDCKINPGGHK